MKKIILLFFILLYGISYAQETTTYYLIRHAEKERSNPDDKNPNLTLTGHKRALKWRDVFENITFDAVYSTDLNRTKQTAQPTADANQLEILFYNPKQIYAAEFQQVTEGKSILIVGHSNTTPIFANKILGKKKYTDIADDNNANLYIITKTGNKTNSILLKVD